MFKLFFLVAIIVVYQNVFSAVAITCPRGRGRNEFSDSDYCDNCNSGSNQYNDGSFATCQFCGKYYNNLYCSNSNCVTCTSDETTECPLGSGTSGLASDDIYGCYLCAAGTYQNGTGLTCNSCPMDGSMSSQGASACGEDCSIGALDVAHGRGKCRYVSPLALYFICYIIGTIVM